jgi:hypothetical protein
MKRKSKSRFGASWMDDFGQDAVVRKRTDCDQKARDYFRRNIGKAHYATRSFGDDLVLLAVNADKKVFLKSIHGCTHQAGANDMLIYNLPPDVVSFYFTESIWARENCFFHITCINRDMHASMEINISEGVYENYHYGIKDPGGTPSFWPESRFNDIIPKDSLPGVKRSLKKLYNDARKYNANGICGGPVDNTSYFPPINTAYSRATEANSYNANLAPPHVLSASGSKHKASVSYKKEYTSSPGQFATPARIYQTDNYELETPPESVFPHKQAKPVLREEPEQHEEEGIAHKVLAKAKKKEKKPRKVQVKEASDDFVVPDTDENYYFNEALRVLSNLPKTTKDLGVLSTFILPLKQRFEEIRPEDEASVFYFIVKFCVDFFEFWTSPDMDLTINFKSNSDGVVIRLCQHPYDNTPCIVRFNKSGFAYLQVIKVNFDNMLDIILRSLSSVDSIDTVLIKKREVFDTGQKNNLVLWKADNKYRASEGIHYTFNIVLLYKFMRIPGDIVRDLALTMDMFDTYIAENVRSMKSETRKIIIDELRQELLYSIYNQPYECFKNFMSLYFGEIIKSMLNQKMVCSLEFIDDQGLSFTLMNTNIVLKDNYIYRTYFKKYPGHDYKLELAVPTGDSAKDKPINHEISVSVEDHILEVFIIIGTSAFRQLSNIVCIKLNIHESKTVIYELPIFVKSNVLYKIQLSNFFMNDAANKFLMKRRLVKDGYFDKNLVPILEPQIHLSQQPLITYKSVLVECITFVLNTPDNFVSLTVKGGYTPTLIKFRKTTGETCSFTVDEDTQEFTITDTRSKEKIFKLVYDKITSIESITDIYMSIYQYEEDTNPLEIYPIIFNVNYNIGDELRAAGDDIVISGYTSRTPPAFGRVKKGTHLKSVIKDIHFLLKL